MNPTLDSFYHLIVLPLVASLYDSLHDKIKEFPKNS